MNIIFFEDAYTQRITINFVRILQYELPWVNFYQANNFNQFEELMTLEVFDIFILDIITPISINHDVPSSRTGIELLRRIKSGEYPNQKRNAIVIMRTARAQEVDIRNICHDNGADHCYRAGFDDFKIIDEIRNIYENMG